MVMISSGAVYLLLALSFLAYVLVGGAVFAALLYCRGERAAWLTVGVLALLALAHTVPDCTTERWAQWQCEPGSDWH